MTRVASGVTLAVLTLALLLYGSAGLFFLVIEAVAAICLIEFFSMLRKGSEPAFGAAGTVSGAALLAAFYTEDAFLVTALASVVTTVVFGGAVVSEAEKSFRKTSNTLAGVLYVSVTLGSLVLARKLPDGHLYLITLITANAIGDTFAYYTGRAIGKRPLAPTVSPNKTVEGFIGGAVGSMLAAVACKLLFLPSIGFAGAIVIGLISGLAGPVGDLAESSLKRRMGVKDSGKIVPGHGGALDRLDSLMFSSVFFYIYLRLTVAP